MTQTILRMSVFWSHVGDWLLMLGIVAGLWFGLQLLRLTLSRRLERRYIATHALWDDLAYRISKRTWIYLRLAALIYSLAFFAPNGPVFPVIAHTLSMVLVLIQIALWATDGVNLWVAHYVKAHSEDTSVATKMNALGMLSKIGVWTLLLLMGLDNIPGIRIDTLIASLGVGSVAVALAVQSILSDLFASLSIVFDKPFEIGDFINVGEYSGTVEYIGLKSTRLRSLTGEQLVFANSDLLASRIRNYKRMRQRRISFILGVSPETPYDKLVQIPALVQAIIEAQPETSFDRAHFKTYGDFTLDYEIVYYMTSTDYRLFMDTQQTINLEIYRQFDDMGIALPYPTQTVLLK